MPTRNVVISEPQARFVEQLVDSGRYQNVSEILREGLRLVQQRELEQSARLQVLREAVAIGVADVDAGRYTQMESALSLRARMTALTETALAHE